MHAVTRNGELSGSFLKRLGHGRDCTITIEPDVRVKFNISFGVQTSRSHWLFDVWGDVAINPECYGTNVTAVSVVVDDLEAATASIKGVKEAEIVKIRTTNNKSSLWSCNNNRATL